MSDNQHIATYKQFGLNIKESSSGEATCTCPFCGHSKLYINEEEGLYHCHYAACGEQGNKYTFLNRWHDLCLDSTTQEQYKEISEKKGLPEEAFINAGVAYDKRNNKWLIPVRNGDSKIVNIRQWNSSSNILKQTAGCKAHLYNHTAIKERPEGLHTVYLCEGEFDAIALQHLLTLVPQEGVEVVAVPGANTFKEAWAEDFRGLNVVICYDNDEAGDQGSERTTRILQDANVCKSIKWLFWPKECKDKHDLRDHIIEYGSDPQLCFDLIQSYLDDAPIISSEVVRCSTFDELVKHFGEHIHLSDEMVDGLLLMCATIISNEIIGDPIWLFLVGPPGGGKTLLLQAAKGLDKVVYQSSLGKASLVSGRDQSKTVKDENGKDKKITWDGSLINKVKGKTLVLKDYTEIMSLSTNVQDEVMSQLRGAYDDDLNRTYGSATRDYSNCRFTMLAGVTNAIHGNSKAALGERFIKYQMVSEGYNPENQIRAAIGSAIKQESAEIDLQGPFKSFINKLSADVNNVPTVPDWVVDKLIGLSQIVAMLRAQVERKGDDLLYRPTPEVGTRLAKVLIKLGQCVAIVLGKNEIDKECYSIMSRVALDTCYGWHREVFLAIAENDPNGLTKNDLHYRLSIPRSVVKKVVDDLGELGAIRADLEVNGKVGKDSDMYVLTDLSSQYLLSAKIHEEEHSRKLLMASSLTKKPRRRIRRRKPR